MSGMSFKTKMLRLIWGTVPWIMIAGVLAFIVVMFGRIKVETVRLAEAKRSALKTQVPAIKVITLTVEPSSLEDTINLPAYVEPFEELWVKAEVSGQVVDIPVKEGQKIKRGQVLAQLDQRDYVSRLDMIESNYRLAKLDHKRFSTLTEKKIAAVQKLDEIEARLKDLEAQRRQAQLALKRTTVTAPISGRINEIKTKVGDLLSTGQEIAQILQLEMVKVTVGVPESDVASIFDLKGADVVIEALDRRRVEGKKIFLSRKPRTLSRLYDLELAVPNPDGRILPGMFARVNLVKSVYEEALTVPLYTVITEGGERFVYVEREGKAEKRQVELGVLVDWLVHIRSGISPGDRVIVVGHRIVSNGQAVEVIKNVLDPREILIS